ncbi:MAG: glycosyltransferase family 39 protein [Acidobacteriia bacterium]|nr:glycosyltransferase family 39 protein [Terriglobia bacterium]
MDDVDAVQAQIARNMLASGDWVTAHMNGIAYLEKAPLVYWMMAASFRLLGVHDWSARLPLALAVIALCWVTGRFGAWAFGTRAGLYSGLVLSTCIGLFLFTRILIPDATLTLTITLMLWSFLRVLDPEEVHPRLWAAVMAASVGAGLLLKGLVALVFPAGAGFVYLAATRQLFLRDTWKKLCPLSGLLIVALLAAPWHVLATLRNPPFFDFTMHSAPGEYRGFFWFYFINEHVLRFLNLRYPRDYNTVPRLWFWLLQLVWLFPWSFYFPAAARLRYKPVDRAGRARLLALCWFGVVMVFFTLSTTQEYYSMPAYPALALLLGSAMTEDDPWVRRGTLLIGGTAAAALAVIAIILLKVRGMPTPGDISVALRQHPELYTFSLGHIGDLTLRGFAYLQSPLLLAGIAVFIGAAGLWVWRENPHRAFLAAACMMVVFFHAARLAMVAFDSYLGSKPLADALMTEPGGKLVEADAYYSFSSVFFYTNRQALLWNGRKTNLEYGSYAPGAPHVFIDDADLKKLWTSGGGYYLLAGGGDLPRLRELLGPSALHIVKESGGKYLITTQPLPAPP